jgi:protein O-mannosyl-transferase
VSSRASATKKRAAQTTVALAVDKPQLKLRNESFLYAALLLIATLAIYLPVRNDPFFNFDDPAYVVNNPHIASGLNWETVSWAFTTFYQFNWHPLTWLSHAADVQLFQLEPSGPHMVNLLLAALNVLLLFELLVRATGCAGRSAMVAGLFALHPVNVESVAWISERKNLLSMFFFLLGMIAYRWYTTAGESEGGTRVRRYAVMTLCFAMGLMSKPQIVTFPLLLLLWDYWPLERVANSALRYSPFALRQTSGTADSGEKRIANGEWRSSDEGRSFLWLVTEKIPLLILCAASVVVTVIAQRAGGAMASLQNYPLSVRLTNAIVCYARYIRIAVWPERLAPLYPHPWQPLPMWQVLPALFALIAISAWVWVERRRRYLVVGWLWFLGGLVPMIGIVHVGNQAMADRYAYLPYIGLFLMICWGVAEFVESRHVSIAALRIVSVLVLAASAIVTHRQLSFWGDNAALWRHTLAVTDGNYIAHDNLAHVLLSKGQPEEAVQHFQAALAIYPSDPNALLGLALYEQQKGNLDQALAHYGRMAAITPAGPARAEVLVREGLVYLDMEDKANARARFSEAVAMDPQSVQGWLGLGVAAERSGDLPTAIENFKHANAIKPQKVTYMLLAKALEESGDVHGAEAAREQAKLLPNAEKTTRTYSGGILQH